MQETTIYPVCVIGGGSAGTMAALRTVLNNDLCLFFPGSPRDKKKSRALWVRKVENVPAHLEYKRGIEEPNLETLKWIAESPFKEKLQLQKNTGVVKVARDDQGIFTLTDSKGQVHRARHVILCTGVMDVQPEIGGSIENIFDYANAQTIDYCLICDGHHVLGRQTTVIGHTDSAAWVAILLHERYSPPEMNLLLHGKLPTISPENQRLLDAYGVRVIAETIAEVQGEEKGKVLKGFRLEDGNVVQSEIAFVSLGMIVYNELALQLGAQVDERGFVIADEKGETTVPNLYVAGDLKAGTRKQIYTAWDNAVSAASAINQKIRAAGRPI